MLHDVSAIFVLTSVSCYGLVAQSSQQVVIPAPYSQTDANSFEWIAGASQPLHQQTLIGASHLQRLLQATNPQITGFALRRNAANEVYNCGAANLTVRLSTSPRSPLTCSDAFAANVGQDVLTVFQGTIPLPVSPADRGPNIAWSAANTVPINFAQPFPYHGGTLCLDVVVTPITGQTADWWMADAVFEDIMGTQTEIGSGCGAYGGPLGRWSFVDPRPLLAGGHSK